jgi:hypothetical protein
LIEIRLIEAVIIIKNFIFILTMAKVGKCPAIHRLVGA